MELSCSKNCCQQRSTNRTKFKLSFGLQPIARQPSCQSQNEKISPDPTVSRGHAFDDPRNTSDDAGSRMPTVVPSVPKVSASLLKLSTCPSLLDNNLPDVHIYHDKVLEAFQNPYCRSEENNERQTFENDLDQLCSPFPGFPNVTFQPSPSIITQSCCSSWDGNGSKVSMIKQETVLELASEDLNASDPRCFSSRSVLRLETDEWNDLAAPESQCSLPQVKVICEMSTEEFGNMFVFTNNLIKELIRTQSTTNVGFSPPEKRIPDVVMELRGEQVVRKISSGIPRFYDDFKIIEEKNVDFFPQKIYELEPTYESILFVTYQPSFSCKLQNKSDKIHEEMKVLKSSINWLQKKRVIPNKDRREIHKICRFMYKEKETQYSMKSQIHNIFLGICKIVSSIRKGGIIDHDMHSLKTRLAGEIHLCKELIKNINRYLTLKRNDIAPSTFKIGYPFIFSQNNFELANNVKRCKTEPRLQISLNPSHINNFYSPCLDPKSNDPSLSGQSTSSDTSISFLQPEIGALDLIASSHSLHRPIINSLTGAVQRNVTPTLNLYRSSSTKNTTTRMAGSKACSCCDKEELGVLKDILSRQELKIDELKYHIEKLISHKVRAIGNQSEMGDGVMVGWADTCTQGGDMIPQYLPIVPNFEGTKRKELSKRDVSVIQPQDSPEVRGVKVEIDELTREKFDDSQELSKAEDTTKASNLKSLMPNLSIRRNRKVIGAIKRKKRNITVDNNKKNKPCDCYKNRTVELVNKSTHMVFDNNVESTQREISVSVISSMRSIGEIQEHEKSDEESNNVANSNDSPEIHAPLELNEVEVKSLSSLKTTEDTSNQENPLGHSQRKSESEFIDIDSKSSLFNSIKELLSNVSLETAVTVEDIQPIPAQEVEPEIIRHPAALMETTKENKVSFELKSTKLPRMDTSITHSLNSEDSLFLIDSDEVGEREKMKMKKKDKRMDREGALSLIKDRRGPMVKNVYMLNQSINSTHKNKKRESCKQRDTYSDSMLSESELSEYRRACLGRGEVSIIKARSKKTGGSHKPKRVKANDDKCTIS